MTHKYKITGMTCDGCRTSVENKIRAVSGVTEVKVYLENEEAAISMEGHIDTEVFQQTLSPKYGISESFQENILSSSSVQSAEAKIITKEKSKLQQLQPLLIIFLYILVTVGLLNYKEWKITEAMQDFMGLFFIIFSFFKILDLKRFPESFRMYDPLAKAIPVYGWIYPFLETVLGLMLLLRFEIEIALIVTLIILGITTVGVVKTLLNKKSIQCACLGTALKLPMTEATFIENSIMIIMASTMLIKLYFS